MIKNQLTFEYVCPDCSTSLYITAASENVSCGCGFSISFLAGQPAPESPIENFGATVEISREEAMTVEDVKPLKTETRSLFKSDVVAAKKLDHVRVAKPVEMSIMGGAASPSTVIDRKELMAASTANGIDSPLVLTEASQEKESTLVDSSISESQQEKRDRIDQLEEQLRGEKKDVETLTKRLNANEILNEAIQNHAKKNEDGLKSLETQTGTIKVDLNLALQSLTKVKDDLNETQKINHDLVEEIANLKSEMSSLRVEEELQATQSLNANLVKELAALKNEVSTMKTESASKAVAEVKEKESPKSQLKSKNKLKKNAAKGKGKSQTSGLKVKKAEASSDDLTKLQDTAVMMDDFDELKDPKLKKREGKAARTRLSKEDQARLKAEAAEQAKKLKIVMFAVMGVLLIGILVLVAMAK